MKYKVGDVVYIKQGEFEDSVDYIIISDAILIITSVENHGKGKNHDYYLCDVYLCSKKVWQREQLFLAAAYDDDFLPLSNSKYFKEAVASIFEEEK